MASNNGSASVDGKESEKINEVLNSFRKKFCEDGTMDKLKDIFEQELKKMDSHKANIEKLQQVLSSSEQVSYEEAFKDLGGPTFRSKVSDGDDLDVILRKLVKESNVALSEEEQKRQFELWDRVLRKNLAYPLL